MCASISVLERSDTVKINELSLRQRKILYILRNQTDYVPSKDLANALKVSTRTIRNDIHQMNQVLADYNAVVMSFNSKGFLFQAEDPDRILEMSHINAAFFAGPERIRYLAFRLCESDEPLNLYDLEEEVFVSRSVLMSDIQKLKQSYYYDPPYIRLILKGDEVSFENDEDKIRSVMLHLFHEDWDYTANKNAYYGYHFLDSELLELLMKETSGILHRNGIRMDDTTLTAMELLLAIMHYRCKTGHTLPEDQNIMQEASPFRDAADSLFSIIEKQTGMTYIQAEKNRIITFISNTHMDDQLRKAAFTSEGVFPSAVREETDRYLKEIKDVFGVDFSKDMEFVHVLRLFFYQLASGSIIFYQQADHISIKKNLSAEYELAWLYQRLAPDYIGRFLVESELCNLVTCFSGSIRFFLNEHPEMKLRTVLFSHRNMASAWGLKRKLLEVFQLYIDITDILPINYLEHYDLSRTDLAFVTVNTKISLPAGARTLFIDDHPTADNSKNAMDIKLMTFKKIWPLPLNLPKDLFASAYWHENEEYSSRYQVIESMCADYIHDQIATEEHAMDITRREARGTFCVRPGIVLLHTTLPARETKLSVMTLKHRIRWDIFRVGIIVMAMFREEDRNLLFHLKIQFCNGFYDEENLHHLKTKEDLLPLFSLD